MSKEKILTFGLIVFIICFIFFNPVYFVQSGQKAVIKRFGVVKQEVVNEGMRFKTPFIDQVITIDVTPQSVQEEAITYTKDNQPIDVNYTVIYTKPADDVANTVIRYNKNPYEAFAKSKISDSFKAIAGKYTASEFVTKREVIRKEFLTEARLNVTNPLDNKVVINIIDIPITNVDFDDQYESAIKDKQVAQQRAQKAEYVLQQARIDAQSKVVTAEGEAKALQVKAIAISKSPQVVRLEEIKKWDGHYPLNAKVIGGGATIVDSK